ncbi:hypothetical protein ETH_00017115 [Eimeria tenella]|uniref:Uncharacterized protein n=1 Tax=Eimeria tenella TaxID=5802 RepID=U6KT35_EIMTE|nr:hypothetical protein ETH_00017115 [Eimeria tenella]CDJ39524.1 hypothetical protein ETH_00017115 [Eimeria tenella]|eukprot:XP_013230279.1 hypothetical protein ETH_00017115 [Eimeria tenella]
MERKTVNVFCRPSHVARKTVNVFCRLSQVGYVLAMVADLFLNCFELSESFWAIHEEVDTVRGVTPAKLRCH